MAAKLKPNDYLPRQKVACAFMGCPYDAITRQRTPTGWANLCAQHDMEIHQERADAYCAERGLHTTEQKRKWVLEKVKAGLFKRMPVSREPGEDREEMEAA